MRLTIELTDYATGIDGVPCRVWTGRTGSGMEVVVFIHRWGMTDAAAQVELERELLEMPPPVEITMAELEARRRREAIGENRLSSGKLQVASGK